MYKSKQPAIWFKVFLEWHQALDYIKQYKLEINSAFSSDLWIQKQAFFLNHAKDNPMPRYSVLPSFISQKNLTSVVDFGGGSGWLGFYLPKNCVYINQEIAALTNYFEPFNLKNTRIITENALDFISNVDVLYSNSVIQYLPKIDNFINLINELNPNYIVLDDLQISTKSDFFSIQRYFDSCLISRFYKLTDFIDEIEANGYILMESRKYPISISNRMGYRIDQRSWWDPNIQEPKSLFFNKLT